MPTPQGTITDPYSIGGIFTDPAQANSLAANPMFNMGMSVLQSAYNPNVNPFAAAMGGLQDAGQQGRIQAEESRDDQLRKALADFFAQQGGGMPQDPRAAQFGGMPGGAPGAAMPGQAEPGRDYYAYGWGDILNSGT